MDRNKTVEYLKDILKIDTTLGNEKVTADYIEKLLNSYGIETKQVEYAPGRNQLIATLKGTENGKILGLSGHMDVVPVGEMKWQYPPFSAEEVDGKIYARGASDMKSGLMAAVVAVIELKEQNVPLKGDVKLLLTVGEETSAIGAEQLTKLGYADDLDALIIGEPTQNGIGYTHKGALWLRIVTYGHTSHGSMPQNGVNAIEHMLTYLGTFKKEFDFSKDTDSILGPSTCSLDVIKGGDGTNVVPDKCSIEMDIRTIPEQNHDAIVKKAKDIMTQLASTDPSFKGDIEVINNQMPIRTDLTCPFTKIAVDAAKKVLGKDPYIASGSGYTDASQFVKAKKKFPMLIIGPGITTQAHQPNEYLVIKDYFDTISIYEEIIKQFLQ